MSRSTPHLLLLNIKPDDEQTNAVINHVACGCPQVDLHGMLVEEALAELEHHIECLAGVAYRAPDGIALSVITGTTLRSAGVYVFKCLEF